jgi:hypothetical protein
MLQCSILEAIMPRKTESHRQPSPLAILTELAVEGTSSLIEAQRIFLDLVHQENEILMNGVKERVGSSVAMGAMTDLARRGLDTFIGMQQDFLTTTSKQTLHWLEMVQAGKGYESSHLVDLAREGVDKFVHAQRRFLDVLVEETEKATKGKSELHMKPGKKTELSKLASDAAASFIDAQKKVLDVLGQQMNVNLNAATQAAETLSPARLFSMTKLPSEAVKTFVEGEKALLGSMMEFSKRSKVFEIGKHAKGRKTRHTKTA